MQVGQVYPPSRKTRGTFRINRLKHRWKTQTSDEQLWLCELLHEEIRTYLMVVIRAINLDVDDLREAANDIDRACSVQLSGNDNSTFVRSDQSSTKVMSYKDLI
mmetsp:Transcript_13806/g.33419  ORF Transcript_13806/g.33419 Transcript_13806/m.33419 type:complete len:104 (-) Transcript_13806:166-477(-)